MARWIRWSVALISVVPIVSWILLALDLRTIEADNSYCWVFAASLAVGAVWIVVRPSIIASVFLATLASISSLYSLGTSPLGFGWEDVIATLYGVVAPVGLVVEQGVSRYGEARPEH